MKELTIILNLICCISITVILAAIAIMILLRYDEIQKLKEDAYKQGYDAGFHDAMVELDPDAEPLNDKGYVA